MRTRSTLLLLLLVACGSQGGSGTPAPLVPVAVCGDGIVQAGEECDDGNSDNADACLSNCMKPATWVTSDPHAHSSGCGVSGTPDQLYALLGNQEIQIASALVWGDDWDRDRRLFTGGDSPLSSGGRIMHYDLEVSGFAAGRSGHLLLLGLDSIVYSSDPFSTPKSSLFVADWAHGQERAVVGMAHGGFWPGDGSFPSPPVTCCMPWEFPIHAVRGSVSFLVTERRGSGPALDAGTMALWRPVVSSGYRVAIGGASDYPCIHHVMVDTTPRTDVLMVGEGAPSYARYLDALRRGRTAVAIGYRNHLDLRVNGARLGDEVRVRSGTPLTLAVEARFDQVSGVQIVVNGQVVDDKVLPAGPQLVTFTLKAEKSAWIIAASPKIVTSPIYVIVDNKPIRASASDTCYLIRYVDHLSDLVASRSLDLGEDRPDALAEYAKARAELVTRFTEAGGTSCP